MQALEHVGDPLTASPEEDRLRDLDTEALRRHAGRRQHGEEALGKIPVRELRGREIHENAPRIESARQPGAQVARDLLGDARTQSRADLWIVEGGREGGGREQAPRRVMPAGERLETHDGAGAEMHLGLIERDDPALR
ncbi:hypothetical protein AEGHOMDF_5735 [Methylobacterium soli]|nr:hypothetical protein AEGHOMDF_5735 [Methylobacterium soli]